MRYRPFRAAAGMAARALLRLPSSRTGVAALAGAAVFAASVAPSLAAPGTAGTFTDRSGRTHAWSVSQSHALVWDGAPYVPVGGVFGPHYLAEGQTEENWKRDTDALALLKSKGVVDLIVTPTISAASVPAKAWQRVIDYLDDNGFHYGVAFGAGVELPLKGIVVKPSRYRLASDRLTDGATWRVANTDTARYYFVDADDASHVVAEGQAHAQDDEISVSTDQRLGPGTVALLYPHKSLKPSSGLPDVWSGFDAYRDRLLTAFAGVKFGAGLRFFLDPLAHDLDLSGEDTDNLIPESPAFRLEWEAWLKEKWPSIDDIMTRWGLQDRDLKDYAQAARMVPLSAGGRGLAFMLDADSGKRYETRGTAENFWTDFREFRNSSIGYYMNALADVVKREMADVPVVYTRTVQHPIFTNRLATSGFDGLGIAAYGRGSSLATSGADSVMSQAEAAARPMWCLVTETLDTSSPTKDQLGYSSQDALFYDLDWLRDVGAHGFFVNGFQVLPDTVYRNFQLVKSPEQVGWIKSYCDKLTRGSAGAAVTPLRTATLLYPAAAAGYVRSGPIEGTNVWWAPSLMPGKALRFGSSYSGYTITLPEGERTVIWSLRGQRLTHLVVGDPRRVEITKADGTPVPARADLKHKAVAVMLDASPVIVRGYDNEVFPTEAAEDALVLLKRLVDQADAAKAESAFEYRLRLDHAVTNYKLKDARLSYAISAEAVNGLVNILQPYSWTEAESAHSQSFTEVTTDAAASGGAYLSLNTDARPGASGYGAEYSFTVPANDSYAVWMACTPPGPNASPFAWIVDEDQKHSGSEARIVGNPYMGDRFVWLNLGRADLTKGSHTFVLRVTDPASGLGRFRFDVDAIVVTRRAFTPNGIEPPALLGPADIPANGKAFDRAIEPPKQNAKPARKKK